MLLANYYNYNFVGGADPTKVGMVRPAYTTNVYNPVQYNIGVTKPPVQTVATPTVARRTGWDKPPVEKFTSATMVKAMNHIATTPRVERKQDILDDRTLPDNVRKFVVEAMLNVIPNKSATT